jgi:hypothetical protein
MIIKNPSSNASSKGPTNSTTSSQRGVAIIFALFALSAIASLALNLTKNSVGYTYLQRGFNNGLDLSTLLRAAITPPKSVTKRGCEEQTVVAGDIAGIKTPRQVIYVCTNGDAPYASNQKIFPLNKSPDFNEILKNASICSEGRTKTTQNRFYSPYATYNCIYTKAPISGVISLDNIVGENLKISEGASDATTIIATPGALDLSNTLLISTDTVITTGGDIRIPKVEISSVSSRNKTALTLISIHGDINIGELSGDLRLLAYSRHALSVPPSALPDRPILPLLRADSISGIIGAS